MALMTTSCADDVVLPTDSGDDTSLNVTAPSDDDKDPIVGD